MTSSEARRRMLEVLAADRARRERLNVKYDLSKLTKGDWLAIRECRRRAIKLPGVGYDMSKLTPDDWGAIRAAGEDRRKVEVTT